MVKHKLKSFDEVGARGFFSVAPFLSSSFPSNNSLLFLSARTTEHSRHQFTPLPRSRCVCPDRTLCSTSRNLPKRKRKKNRKRKRRKRRRKRKRPRRRKRRRRIGTSHCYRELNSTRQVLCFHFHFIWNRLVVTSYYLPFSTQILFSAAKLGTGNMAQEYTYYPSFDGPPPPQPEVKPSSPPPKPTEYYRYDAGSAGRLTSAMPTYQQAYAPVPRWPAHVAYVPVLLRTPNVPAHCVPAFYVDCFTSARSDQFPLTCNTG